MQLDNINNFDIYKNTIYILILSYVELYCILPYFYITCM